VFRCGSGRPLLYLHSGFGEVGALPLFAALADAGFRVVAPELPGFGRSDPAPDWHRVEDAVFHLRRMCEALSLPPCTVVGSSLGGWLAAELAVWFPDRVSSLVLVDAVGLRVDGAPVFDLFAARQRELLEHVFPHGGDLLTMIAPAIEGTDDEHALLLHFFHAMEATARLGWNPFLHDPKLRGRLPLVSAPALVVWGGDDAVVPVEHGEVYADEIPDATLTVLDGCGHLPALEQPDELAAVVSSAVAVRA
jgi:pimeloyl-ACP methyl ester carboxylesterase